MSAPDPAWEPTAAPIRALVTDLLALTKPRILQLLVATGGTTTVVAATGWPGAAPLTAVTTGGGMAAAGAGSINCALEGDLDRKRARTSERPVAAGRLSARVALTQGIVGDATAFAAIGTAPTTAIAPCAAGPAPWRPPSGCDNVQNRPDCTKVQRGRSLDPTFPASLPGPCGKWPEPVNTSCLYRGTDRSERHVEERVAVT